MHACLRMQPIWFPIHIRQKGARRVCHPSRHVQSFIDHWHGSDRKPGGTVRTPQRVAHRWFNHHSGYWSRVPTTLRQLSSPSLASLGEAPSRRSTLKGAPEDSKLATCIHWICTRYIRMFFSIQFPLYLVCWNQNTPARGRDNQAIPDSSTSTHIWRRIIFPWHGRVIATAQVVR